MNKGQERKMAVLERIDIFLDKNPLTPAIARATELTTDLKLALSTMRQQGGDQQQGFGDFRGGSSERQDKRRTIYKEIRDISDTLSSLDPEQFPGVGEQFRLPKVRSYQRLMDTARAFLGAIGPVKAALIQRGFHANFDEELQTLVADFDLSTDRKNAGRQKQRTGTGSLADTEATVSRKIRELDAIVSKVLKTASPGLLSAWKSAVRVYAAPKRTPDEEVPAAGSTPPSPAGAGGTNG